MTNQHNPANTGDGIISQPPSPVDSHNQVVVENLVDYALRMQPPVPHPQMFCRGNINIIDSDGPFVIPPLPLGHTFVVTSSLIQMLTATCLFSRLPFEDLHAHIANLISGRKSCVGRADIDMYVIGLRHFTLSLKGEASIWFTK